MSQPIWQYRLPEFPSLDSDARCDVLVIGGGICGLLCAYYLQKSGVDVLVCEAERIAGETTARSTAVISVGQPSLIRGIADKSGINTARRVLAYRLDAVEEYKRIAAALGCAHEVRDFYLYDSKSGSKLSKEQRILSRLGVESELCDSLSLGIPTAAALRFADQIQLHPLDLCAKLVAGLNIRECTRITHLTDTGAMANGYTIAARHVIIATHFPLPRFRGLYSLKLYQERSYVLALEGMDDIGFAAEDISPTGFYLRSCISPDGTPVLLLGGGDHRTGVKNTAYEPLLAFRSEYFMHTRILTSWAAQDTVSLDGLPYIGRLTRGDTRNLVACGFGGNGFSGSMISARILTDLICGRGDETLFDPARSMLTMQLWGNIGAALKSYITPSTRRCPHLGCALVWNSAERTWDCPCHGSRFSKTGELESGPAQRSCE